MSPTAEPSRARRACYACAKSLGSERSTARLVAEGGSLRAVELCAMCAGDASTSAPVQARATVPCSECGQPAPATGKAVATGTGISISCGRCSGEEPAAPPRPARQPPARRSRFRAVSASTVAVALAAAGLSFTNPEPPAPASVAEELETALSAARAAAPSRNHTELRVPPRERPRVHDLSFAPGDAEIPLAWYHPLAGDRVLPDDPSRVFGAHRPGGRPPECGEGHCGVDLGYERGPIVHAARPGLIDRIVSAPDRLGGQYVRIYHPEGFYTYYMHLDVIRPSLVPGVEVAAGEPIGTLGSTGIKHSPPHLHFAVSEILDSGAQRYVDPGPMLRQAVVLAEPAPLEE